MSDNQLVFEVIRDIGYVIQNMDKDKDKILAITVVKDNDQFFSWRTSQGRPCGKSETSRAIQQAYRVTRGRPDPRDERIKELEAALKPFADCADQLDGDEDVTRTPDEEWVKFRLLASDYRKARNALKGKTNET